MPVYVLILDQEDPQVWENVRSNWPAPNHHIHDERVAYVKDDTKITSEVAETAAVGDKFLGVVVQADYKAGYTSPSLVEWLNKFS